MRWKKAAASFVGMWIVLFVFCIVVDDQLTIGQQVGYTGALALVMPLLYAVSERSKGEKGKRYSVCRAGEEEVLCRVEGEWICPGDDGRPTHYIRNGKVFSFAKSGALYRIRNAEVYRAGEKEPFLRVEGDKVLCAQSGRVLYELRENEEKAEKENES